MPALPNPDYLNHPRLKDIAASVTDDTRKAALSQFLPAFQRAYLDWTTFQRPDYTARTAGAEAAMATLQRDGVVLLSVPEPAKRRMHELAQPHVAALEEKFAGMAGSKPKFRDMNVQ